MSSPFVLSLQSPHYIVPLHALSFYVHVKHYFVEVHILMRYVNKKATPLTDAMYVLFLYTLILTC